MCLVFDPWVPPRAFGHVWVLLLMDDGIGVLALDVCITSLLFQHAAAALASWERAAKAIFCCSMVDGDAVIDARSDTDLQEPAWSYFLESLGIWLDSSSRVILGSPLEHQDEHKEDSEGRSHSARRISTNSDEWRQEADFLQHSPSVTWYYQSVRRCWSKPLRGD